MQASVKPLFTVENLNKGKNLVATSKTLRLGNKFIFLHHISQTQTTFKCIVKSNIKLRTLGKDHF